MCGFSINILLSAIFSAESRFIDGSSDSLWPDGQPWFPWFLMLRRSSTSAHRLGIDRWVVGKANGKFYSDATCLTPVLSFFLSSNVTTPHQRRVKLIPTLLRKAEILGVCRIWRI